jgi:hypothetical protein
LIRAKSVAACGEQPRDRLQIGRLATAVVHEYVLLMLQLS